MDISVYELAKAAGTAPRSRMVTVRGTLSPFVSLGSMRQPWPKAPQSEPVVSPQIVTELVASKALLCR